MSFTLPPPTSSIETPSPSFDPKTAINQITSSYNAITSKRSSLIQQDLNNKMELEAQAKELSYLQNQITTMKTDYDTSSRKIQNEMYNRNRHEYYINLYKILVFIQILIILALVGVYFGMLPKVITFFVIFLVVLLTVMFLIYYLYYNNTDRSSFEWDKYYFNGNPPNSSNTNSQCALPLVSAEAQELQILEENADNILSKYTSSGLSCNTPPIPSPSTPSSTPSPPPSSTPTPSTTQ